MIPKIFENAFLASPQMAWYIFWTVIFFFVVYSLILLYHWMRYSESGAVTLAASLVYFGGSIVLINIMFFSVINFVG